MQTGKVSRTQINQSPESCPQENAAPKALLSCVIHSVCSNRDIQKSSATYAFTYMPGNRAHRRILLQGLKEVDAHPVIKFRFSPHCGCENEIALQQKLLCMHKTTYLMCSSAPMQLFGKISPGKEINGAIT